MRRLLQPGHFPVQPWHISAEKGIRGSAFGNIETEDAATWVVRFCQERAHWGPFCIAELNAFYSKLFPRSITFPFAQLVNAKTVFADEGKAMLRVSSCTEPLHAVLETSDLERRKVGGGWIELDEEGMYHLTAEFIMACLVACPAEGIGFDKVVLESESGD